VMIMAAEKDVYDYVDTCDCEVLKLDSWNIELI